MGVSLRDALNELARIDGFQVHWMGDAGAVPLVSSNLTGLTIRDRIERLLRGYNYLIYLRQAATDKIDRVVVLSGPDMFPPQLPEGQFDIHESETNAGDPSPEAVAGEYPALRGPTPEEYDALVTGSYWREGDESSEPFASDR